MPVPLFPRSHIRSMGTGGGTASGNGQVFPLTRPTDPSSIALARARAARREYNVIVNEIERLRVVKPEEWDAMTAEQQLAWARRRLQELAEAAEDPRVQTIAASALARSLEPKRPRPEAPTDAPSQAQTMSRGYLEAVVAEASAKLAEMDRKKS